MSLLSQKKFFQVKNIFQNSFTDSKHDSIIELILLLIILFLCMKLDTVTEKIIL